MNITDFTNKVIQEFGVEPTFEKEYFSEFLTKSNLKIKELTWFGIGFNFADANESAIGKACKYFKWE